MPPSSKSQRCRHLVLVLGDQLDAGSAAFDGFDKAEDAVWMAEVAGEAEHVWSSQPRIAMFLACMRHAREAFRKRKITVHYRQIDDRGNRGTLGEELAGAMQRLRPERLIVVEPGEYRVRKALIETAREAGVELELRPDRHFLGSVEAFNEHAEGRKQLILEHFYRWMRREHDVLVTGGEPIGEQWNFDVDNRESFAKTGPEGLAAPQSFRPDAITREVLDVVRRRFGEHPGGLDHFDWPVTPRQARAALDDFITHRLGDFGTYQDAMWTGEPYLFHSRLSAALNLKLLDPRDVIAAAEVAYHDGAAPINAVEGFIRQVLGWREFVRGVYGRFMPDYLERNGLGAEAELPGFYWTGETDMACLREAIGQTLAYGYAHHIQRLMVTGLFALLLGVRPKAVHAWYLAVYVDAVEWVELPNTLGMSQFADGGIMATKPYAATGKYIRRQSNYCGGCRYDPDAATGETACPFTTLYWDFLARNRERLAKVPRMGMQLRNVDRKAASDLKGIRRQADEVKRSLA